MCEGRIYCRSLCLTVIDWVKITNNTSQTIVLLKIFQKYYQNIRLIKIYFTVKKAYFLFEIAIVAK